MGQQIIKQPNYKYAVFSSISDGFIICDATREQIVDLLVENERERIQASTERIFKLLDEGGKPYHQFTMTWEEALKKHESRYGKLYGKLK